MQETTQHYTQQEKRELRHQEKESERAATQRRRLLKRARNYALAVIVLAVIGYGLYAFGKSFAPNEEDLSLAVPVMSSTAHIAVGSPLPEYTSNPPTSGPHYGQTARSGFREEEIADQHIIHNLEHGDIWISYNPRVGDAIAEELRDFAAAKVIITPRSANETDIALASWGRLDAFNIEDGTLPVLRIEDFIKRYINQGPEKVPGASGGI